MSKKIQIFLGYKTIMSTFSIREEGEVYGTACSLELKEGSIIPDTTAFLLKLLEDTPEICLAVFDNKFIFKEGVNKLVTEQETKDVNELREQFLNNDLIEVK